MDKKYGCFSDDEWEYIISTPHTPRKWMNYIGNKDYGVCVAQDGTGFSTHNPPEGSRVTNPESGKYVYLKDTESGKIWSAAYEPVHSEFDKYECHHSIGYTKFVSEIYGIRSEIINFVPLNETLECLKINIKNLSSRNRNIQVFPYIEWYLAGYLTPWDAHENYSHCYFDENYNSVTCVLDDPLYPWISHQGVMLSSGNVVSYDCSKAQFLGQGGSLERPHSVETGKCSNSNAGTEDCIAAMQFEMQLKPNEEKHLNIVIAYSKKMNDYIKNAVRYTEDDNVSRAFNDVNKYFKEKFSAYHIESPDKKADCLLNIWLKHQITQANIWCRGGYSRGYRDTLQDAAGIVSFDKELSKLQIERTLRHQYYSGFAPRQFAEEGGPHDVRMYSDSPVWIPYAVNCYVKETGDFDFLNKKVSYLEEGNHDDKLEYAVKQVDEFLGCSNNSGTIFEHAVKAMDYMWNKRGAHGLSLILGGDWNDPLNYAGRKGKGESVWLSMIFVFAMNEMAELCKYIEEASLSDEFLKRSGELKKLINQYAWDGEWYIRAFDDSGNKIGSNENLCGKIYILSQSWAVISGTADGERADKALASVKKYLDTPYGFLTMTPSYKSYDASVGRISILRPGTFENSAIYCHASAWNMLAELINGSADTAYDTYLNMNPYNDEHPSDVSFSEPYVFPNCYFGMDAGKRYGQSVMGWLTATAGWIYKILTEWMIGIRPYYDCIVADPRLPSSWNYVNVKRTFRGTEYAISIKKDSSVKNNSIVIEVDNTRLSTNRIPYFNDNKTHKVNIYVAR